MPWPNYAQPPVEKRWPEDETPRLDAQDEVDVPPNVVLGESVDEFGETLAVFE